MYARITPYKMKPGSRDAATAVLEGLKDRIMALDGISRFINVMDSDGSGYVVSLATNREMSEETAAQVKSLWAAFEAFLETQPEQQSFDVIADWSR